MTLDVQIYGHNMDISDKLDEYVQGKAGKLDKYIQSIQEVRVDLKHASTAKDANDRYIAQITIYGKGFTLRAEERTDDIRSAFDAANGKIQRRIARYKGKHYRDKGDRTSLADEALAEMEKLYMEEEEPEIVRRKKFLLDPMDEQEALEQMKLLGHEDFFVFFNMESSAVNVLYRRRDGSYGLIDTELA